MKTIITYLTEKLKDDVIKWFTNIYKDMITLVKSGELETIDPDVTKLSKPKTGAFDYKDLKESKVFKQILNNNRFGFTVINQMFINAKKYLSKQEDKENEMSQCKGLPYWYEHNEHIYFVGLILYDNGLPDIKEYCNILAIESALNIKDSQKLLKGMLNDFINSVKDTDYQGLSISPTHPKMKAICLKLGFQKAKDNQNILIYKI